MSETETFPLFTFKVLVEFDGEYNVYVARCLETGSVATADDPATVVDMIEELLIDEAVYAIEHDSLANLFSSPSPLAVWNRFSRAAHEQTPKPAKRSLTSSNTGQEVSTEISIAKTALAKRA